ncbi:MAG: hypothetical protein PHW87_08750 [Methanothrix sp.]|nr:hypothetical protein [Methanothrix sp.]
MIGGMGWLSLILAISILFLSSSCAGIGYDIIANVGGSLLEIHRSTQILNFDASGLVNGIGNFSKYSRIDGFAGVKAEEFSSSARPGRLGYADKMVLRNKIGPVVISAKLKSGVSLISDEESQNESQILLISESGKIDVDEKWMTSFLNQKKIMYSGSEIRIKEAYENNGDVVADSINSWALSKESLYLTSINRTLISANFTSHGIDLETSANKSSRYLMNLSTIGSQTQLDVIRFDQDGECANRISQGYIGQQNMSLKINMGDWVLPMSDDFDGWLDCCPSSARITNEHELIPDLILEASLSR